MAYINDKKVISVVKTEFVPAVYQVKTITPSNFTPEVVADQGYAALSKVKLDGILVDPHQSYTTDTDDDVAYQKSVPSGALKYAELGKVGGMSYKSENLYDMENPSWDISSQMLVYNSSINGYVVGASDTWKRTYLPCSNGNTYTITMEIFATTSFEISTSRFRIDNKTNGEILASFSGTIVANTWSLVTCTFTSNTNTTILDFRDGATNGYSARNIMLVSGSLAKPYVPYGVIRDSAVSSVVSKDSNDTTIDTFTIPNEVQALTGYGWGINDTCYNYIDYEAKKFIQKVSSYTFTGEEVINRANNPTTYPNLFKFLGIASLIKKPNNNDIANILIVGLTPCSYNNIGSSSYVNYYTAVQVGGEVWFNVPNIESTTDMLNWLVGKTIYYELATPVETDISQYLDDNYIEVEGNGSLTFTNQYEQAVPSEIAYLVEVSND